jgi:hypothetical protein
MQSPTLTQLENKMHHHGNNAVVIEKKIKQHNNHLNNVLAKSREEEKRARASRLIQRGAIAESLIPNAKNLTNEQIEELLTVALRSPLIQDMAREFISKANLKPS